MHLSHRDIYAHLLPLERYVRVTAPHPRQSATAHRTHTTGHLCASIGNRKRNFWFTIVWRGSRELSALGVSEAVGRVGSLAAHQLRPGVALPARPGRLATLLSDSRLR